MRQLTRLSGLLVAGFLVAGLSAAPGPGHAKTDGAAAEGYARIEASYTTPDVTLRTHEGGQVQLRKLLAGDRPVALQFIFTSCQTVCPMITAMMAQAQDDLREVAPDLRIVSISMDPGYDTPARLARYAEKFDAEGDWTFLTGQLDAVRTAMGAFNAKYGGKNKMYHEPYTYLRAADSDTWVRLNGLMSAGQLKTEFRKALETTAAAVEGR
ncbi:protein SCO1/2 [Limimonas halophila]|uniref:Protein SCO1/2 n=1 Tax=Limimonas halophila TaxID=1082479 RepID=A0A1G7UUT6_9PROT|nr:SCO family protein [Limimonas halophila]SDG51293.1 protein SCO1/2 [Limimonas halophila]